MLLLSEIQTDINTITKLDVVTAALEWYKKLTIDQKIGLKECAYLLTGMKWEDYTLLFTPRQRVELLYDKLKLEGFDV